MHACTTQFNWSEECNIAFSILKGKLVSAPILGYPDSSEDFIIETDASFKGLGVVLSQKIEGKESVIAYASRGLRVAIIRIPIDKQLPNIDGTGVERMAKMQSRNPVISRVRDIIQGNDLLSNVKSELSEVRSYLKACSHRILTALVLDLDFHDREIKYI